MSRTVYLALALLALVCAVSAHAGHNKRGGMPYGWRNTRAVSASSCAFYQCALSNGTCDGTSIFCPNGQHCGAAGRCQDSAQIGQPCDPNAIEDACAQGSCVNSVCAYNRELMPGNPCSADSECSYFTDAAGTVQAGSCVSKKCYGKNAGETCAASHQCVVGNFCDTADSTCKAMLAEGATCDATAVVSGCSSRLTCLDNKCARRFTRAQGQSCSTTENCQGGLYCSASKVCTKVSTKASSNAACDISSSACPANEECSCNSYSTAGQTATCTAIKGTYPDAASAENAAYSCMNAAKCSDDMSNSDNVACIVNNCLDTFCTYITRNVNDLFTDYPTCMTGRVSESNDFSSLLARCNSPVYLPKEQAVSSASALSASFVVLASFAVFFFAL